MLVGCLSGLCVLSLIKKVAGVSTGTAGFTTVGGSRKQGRLHGNRKSLDHSHDEIHEMRLKIAPRAKLSLWCLVRKNHWNNFSIELEICSGSDMLLLEWRMQA